MSRRERFLGKPERERLTGDAYAELIAKVFQRDKWMCRNPFCQSMKSLTPHHLKKRSQLGGDEMGNIITLCVTCHDAVEKHRLEIEVVDLVVKFLRKDNGVRKPQFKPCTRCNKPNDQWEVYEECWECRIREDY